jgi:hypothetical protein
MGWLSEMDKRCIIEENRKLANMMISPPTHQNDGRVIQIDVGGLPPIPTGSFW